MVNFTHPMQLDGSRWHVLYMIGQHLLLPVFLMVFAHCTTSQASYFALCVFAAAACSWQLVLN
jgi:hypothetical protein